MDMHMQKYVLHTSPHIQKLLNAQLRTVKLIEGKNSCDPKLAKFSL